MPRAALLVLALAAMPALAAAQATKAPAKSSATKSAGAKTPKPPARTTLSGVYTLEDAAYGKEMYVGLCASCHQAISHTGPAFRKKWTGRPLSELYNFMRTQMPKNDPATLADEDYAALLSYMLQMNQMPAGKTALSTDTLELAKIRIDTARAVRKP
jgi:mono/diheme cytochrome c family protein